MAPHRILLIRHAESQRDRSAACGEVDTPLTGEGREQARALGRRIRGLVGHETLAAFVSPYMRAQQTYQVASSEFTPPVHLAMDARLMEQVWGPGPRFERYAPRTFTVRPVLGESTLDVYSRVALFIHDLKIRFFTEEWENVAVFSHGVVLRLFLMHMLDWSLEEFESLHNTRPGDMFILERTAGGPRFRVTSPLDVKGDCVLPLE